MSKKSPKKVKYVAMRLFFEGSAVVNGTAEVWVPASVADEVECGTPLGDALEEALLDANLVEWDEQADVMTVDSPTLDMVEAVDQEEEAYPAHRCCLTEDGEWHIVAVTENDNVVVEQDED